MTGELRRLIREMAVANPLWGAPRIHGELGRLGLSVSERTVSRLMPRRRRPPSQTWRTFLQNHARALVALDFFTVPTLTGRVLFVLVVLAHERRRILHVSQNFRKIWCQNYRNPHRARLGDRAAVGRGDTFDRRPEPRRHRGESTSRGYRTRSNRS